NPDFRVDTTTESPENAAERIVNALLGWAPTI
ncbi:hypothetical protein GGR37_003366, partial [Novosphingobium taihuense]|nr:hypothetical protein [Novosphingobium taihuense]